MLKITKTRYWILALILTAIVAYAVGAGVEQTKNQNSLNDAAKWYSN